MFDNLNKLRNEDGTINWDGEYERMLSVLINNAEIPSNYIDLILNEIELKVTEKLKIKPRNINEGCKLYLYSAEVGTGKTTIATFYLQKYIEWYCKYRGSNSIDCVGFFVNCRDYILLKKAAIKNQDLLSLVNQIEDKMRIANLVVFDEIGQINMSDYDGTLLYSIVNYREAHKKASIFTSNYSPEKLLDNIGASIARRILQGAYTILVK